MDSSSKSETSTESSSTSSNKSSENDQQKDLQSKQASTKTSISSNSSLGVGSSAGIGVPATTTTADTAKAISVTTSATSATTATTSSSSSTPHSVTISLGVGVLQVGKPQPRIPSPPKLSGLNSSSSQDVTTNSVTSTLASTGGNKEAAKTVASTSSVSVFTPITTSSFENPASKAVTETAKSSVSVSSQNQPLISNPLATPPVVSETSSTGGVLTAVSSTLSAMKRPPSEISGSSNSGTPSTETGEPEASTEHKRKKMKKENRTDRSDSPGSSTSTASMAGLGRGVRNSGSKQGSPSSSVGGSGIGEFSGKTSIFPGKSNDGPSSAQEKSDDSSKSRSHEGSVSSSSIGSGNNASNTSGNSYGLSSNGGGGPKVPPLKIVLQSHSHSTVTTASSTGGTSSVSVTFKNSSGGEDSTQNSSFGSGTGFPYVVSSTTADPNNSGSNAPETVPMSVPNPLSSKSSSQMSKNNESNEAQNEISKDPPQPPKTFGLSTNTPNTSSSTASDISSSTAATSNSTTTASSTSSSTSITISTASGNSDKFKDTTSISNTNESSTDVTHDKLKSDDDLKKDTGNSQNGNSTSSSTPSASSNSSQSSTTTSNDPDKEKELAKEKDGSSKDTGATPKEKEKPVRVTRSSQRILKEGVGSHTPNSPSSSSPKTSACPSPSHTHQTDSQGSMEGAGAANPQAPQDGTEKMDTSEPVELHPRKRKIKNKDVPATSSCTASSSSSSNAAPEDTGEKQQASANAANEQPMLNCFEMYLNIRKQIDRRRRNLFHVTPKPPKGFKDYLMNRATYVLAGNANALAVPLLNPPQSQPTPMKEFFSEQEKERHKLRLQHLVEKEKLVLSVEQEILRVHGRAARALSNQTLPFSVCTILKDQEVYNLLTPEQEEKDINARSRYNGRLFLSWLQDVDDKWDKIKEFMLLRHHNEAESLHAVQKMDWEWKLKEHGLCELKANPIIDDLSVPMVHVSDDFDLLPA
ncbi:unnamed protein product [Orchesella dallaii]|uniref:Ankyrin repeat domain-containing protein 12 n=1 Tax=Orchesella dallaii TaxID=48710 RepID=A0ABP1QB16_9HEXA